MKKLKLLCTAGLLFVCLSATAQRVGSAWSLETQFTTLKAIQPGAMFPDHTVFAYQTGMSVGYNISNRWEVLAGVRYAQRGFGQNSDDQRFQNPVVNPNGGGGVNYPDPVIGCPMPTVPNEGQLIGFRHQLRSLEAPISARYYFVKNKVNLFAQAGGTYHYILNYRPETISTIQEVETDRQTVTMDRPQIRGLNISAHVGVGASIAISDRFSVFVQSGLDYFIPSTNDQALVEGWNVDLKGDLGLKVNL